MNVHINHDESYTQMTLTKIQMKVTAKINIYPINNQMIKVTNIYFRLSKKPNVVGLNRFITIFLLQIE